MAASAVQAWHYMPPRPFCRDHQQIPCKDCLMEAGQPSVTAQRVAAQRLTFGRAAAGYGDPAADETLARDVAAEVSAEPGWMREYLRARTQFFDRVVTGALDRGCPQVVVGAAGYDGRALRYAKPGVRWFEVDHPATQADKRSRLARLGIGTGHVAFVAADFAVDPVAGRLVAAGLAPEMPSLFLLEGVAVYLELPVLRALLEQLRRVAADGSSLAISLSVSTDSPERAERRAAFQAAVAAVGEPARSVLASGDAEPLLAAAGWRTAPVSPAGPADPGASQPGQADRSHHAGFVRAAPA
jgi:methyltransferase (TIGR00027 family)